MLVVGESVMSDLGSIGGGGGIIGSVGYLQKLGGWGGGWIVGDMG